MMNREKIEKSIDLYYNEVYNLGEYLTKNPEISCQEENSCRYIVDFLTEHDYEVTTPCGGMPNSFLAIDKGRINENIPKVAFLCEYDALPEIGHACGHSISCAISILGAMALRNAFPDLPYRIDLIGTPAEEFGGGKCIMTENGVFDDYEYAAMIHLNNVDVTYFKVPACNDRYFTFHGKASHASASPEEGINALNAARLYMEGMDMWRQHITSDCQFHGIVVKGGTAPNIIPEEVTLDYYFRAATIKGLWELNKIAENCAKGAAIITGATVEWEQRYPDYADIYWNDDMERIAEEAFEDVGRSSDNSAVKGGSSDIGNVSLKIPVFHMMLDVTDRNPEIILHDRLFAEALLQPPAQKGLKDGAEILAGLTCRLAAEPETMRRIKEAHHKYREV